MDAFLYVNSVNACQSKTVKYEPTIKAKNNQKIIEENKKIKDKYAENKRTD